MIFVEMRGMPPLPWSDEVRHEVGYQLSGRVLEKLRLGEDSVTLHIRIEFKDGHSPA